MLQKMNEKIQGLIAWIVIVLIAITFTLFGLDYYLQRGQSKQAKAEVNGDYIDLQSFESTYRRARAQQNAAQMTTAQDKLLKENILESLISNKLAMQGAKNLGFGVSLAQADATILGIPQFQQNGRFSAERYQQALNVALFTPQTFQKEVQQGMLLNQQRFAFIGTSFVLPEEMDRFVRLYMQNRDFSYTTLSIKDFSKNVKITDEQLKNYFNTHQNDFKTDEQVKLQYISLDMNAVRNNIQMNEEQVKTYYENNKNNFLVPAKWQVAHIFVAVPASATDKDWAAAQEKAMRIYADLSSGKKPFEDLVKTESDDKLSIAKQGILPWISAGQTPFDKTLVQLKQPGDLSKPLKTTKGYEIFQLKQFTAAKMKPFAEVKTLITNQITAEKTQEKYTSLLEQLTELSFQNADSLKPVATALNLPLLETDWFSRKGGTDKLTKNKKLINTAFSQDVLDGGNNSEPLAIDNDHVLVIRIAKHKPSRNMQFDEVKSKIAQLLTREQAMKEIKSVAQALVKSQTAQREELMKQHGLKWTEVKDARREAPRSNSEINQLAFTLNTKQSIAGEFLNNGDYALVQLQSIHPGKLADLDKDQMSSIKQQLAASYGLMAYDLYMKSLEQQAEIKKY